MCARRVCELLEANNKGQRKVLKEGDQQETKGGGAKSTLPL